LSRPPGRRSLDSTRTLQALRERQRIKCARLNAEIVKDSGAAACISLPRPNVQGRSSRDVAYDGEAPDVVLDWKSDIAPSAQNRAQYRGQLQDYMAVVGARHGAVVHMSLGEVAWV
jgi:hypothetical protein